MITEVRLYVLRGDGSGHDLLKSYAPPSGEDRLVTLRHAHDLLATWLDAEYPGEWVYYSGDIEQNQFNGQYQFKDGGRPPHGYVPAYVSYIDPEEENARRKAEAARHAEVERQTAALQARVDASPALAFSEGGEAIWNEAKRINDDPYGGAVIVYAERWARLMQMRINAGEALEAVADSTSHEADTEGITGFMYGAAVHTLSQCWIHGIPLRVWHNRKYNVDNDAGTVNPAIVTLAVNS